MTEEITNSTSTPASVIDTNAVSKPEVSVETKPATPVEEKPKEELLLGKFKSQDDLLKAYQELEKKLGSKEPAKEEKVAEKKEAKEEPKKEESAPERDVIKEFGLPAEAKEHVDKYSEKYGSEFKGVIADVLKNGKITEKSEADLKKLGVSKQAVEAMIATETKLAEESIAKAKLEHDNLEKEVRDAINHIGGDEARLVMVDWALKNLDEKTLNRFKRMEQGTSEDAINMLFELESRYSRANGRSPRKVLQGKATSTDTGAFKSEAELIKAMSDPRWKKDSKYRASVISRTPKSF